jgi:hypothetical protein
MSFAMMAFMWSGISVHLLSMLGLLGFSSAAGVTIGAMIGPSQVLGRVGDMLYGSKFHPLNVLQVSSMLLPIAFIILVAAQGAGWSAAIFAVLYGVSIGMNTIARGAVPLALFGPIGYGAAESLRPPTSPRPWLPWCSPLRSTGVGSGGVCCSHRAPPCWLGAERSPFRSYGPRTGEALLHGADLGQSTRHRAPKASSVCILLLFHLSTVMEL